MNAWPRAFKHHRTLYSWNMLHFSTLPLKTQKKNNAGVSEGNWIATNWYTWINNYIPAAYVQWAEGSHMKIIQTPAIKHGNGKSHPLSIFQETLDWLGRSSWLSLHPIPRSHLRKKNAPAIRSVQHLGCAGSAEDSLTYGGLLVQEKNDKSVVKL